jgi:hypothetical protein
MELTKEDLQGIVREVLSNVKESDLIVKRTKKPWSEHKSELKGNIEKLFKYIEEDKYYEDNGVEEISELIDDTVEILDTWKKRIRSNAPKGDVLDEN